MGAMNESPGARDLVALLAEPDRLRALAAVALGAETLAEVTERTGMEPRAAARALSRLTAGGLLDGETGNGYRVRAEALRAAAIPPAEMAEAAGPDAAAAPAGPPPGSPQADVLRRFVNNGRLLSMPAAHGKRLVVLDYLAGLFEPGRRYPESEVNELLGAFHPDYALLRRYLVDDGFLDRADEPAPSGSRSVKLYWRTGGSFELDQGRSPTSA